MPKDIKERLKALTGEDRKIEKVEETKVDKRKFNKGFPQSGRKPKEANLVARGIQSYLDSHFNEKVKILVTDPKTGKSVEVDKPRILAVLQKLYEIGMKGDGDADALNKWLDRALGKPKQVVVGDDENPPFKLQINIANILDKAYGTKSSGDREVHIEG